MTGHVRVEVVAAVAANGVIGRAGALPWHLPEDLKHFKSLTLGHPILMGRKTFDSIGKALPGRRNIVVSRTLERPPVDGVELAKSLDAAIACASTSSDRAFIIGGAAMYADAIPNTDVLHLTELDEEFAGDTFFPAFDRSVWRVTNEVAHPRDERHAYSFYFRTYERAAPGDST